MKKLFAKELWIVRTNLISTSINTFFSSELEKGCDDNFDQGKCL